MFTVSQKAHIAWCWLLSHFRNPWVLDHYPVFARPQPGMPVEAAWCARILNWAGPIGLGHTRDEALSALKQNFDRIAAARWNGGDPLPRPRTGVPIKFASSSRVEADPEALDHFVGHIFEFGSDDPWFISDESSLEDFCEPHRVQLFKDRILQHYGVDIRAEDSTRIADILVRVRSRER